MGLFTPKYPTPDTPGATSASPRRASRGARKARRARERLDAIRQESWHNARRASTERSARFWEDYEQRYGEGSVDWS